MDLLSFRVGPQTLEETRAVFEAFLEALTVANELYYRRLPKGPCCPACAGVRYELPARGAHEFSSVECMVVAGTGACGDLAAMVAGRRRARGEDARVKLELVDPEEGEFHAVVELADGSTIDPTAELLEETGSATDNLSLSDRRAEAAAPVDEVQAPACSCGV